MLCRPVGACVAGDLHRVASYAGLCRPVGAGMVRAVLFISNAGGERILQSGLAFFGIVFAYMGNFLYLCNRFEVKDEIVRGRRGNDSKK